MSVLTADAGHFLTGHTGTGATADMIQVPDAEVLWIFVRNNSGVCLVYLDRSLDGVNWTGLTGPNLNVPAGATSAFKVEAPVGFVRLNFFLNGNSDAWWDAQHRK